MIKLAFIVAVTWALVLSVCYLTWYGIKAIIRYYRKRNAKIRELKVWFEEGAEYKN